MLTPELLRDKDFVFVEPDFVNVTVAQRTVRSSKGAASLLYDVKYVMRVYLNLHLALIKEFDEIEARITDHTEPKLSYFTSDTSPEGVSSSVTSFISRVRTTLTDSRKTSELASTRVKVSSYLDDQTVAGIGSGRINKENYELFLPSVDVAKNSWIETETKPRDIDLVSASRNAKKSFEEYSLHPSEIVKMSSRRIPSNFLPSLELFELLDDAQPSSPKITSESAKQKYKPCNIVVSINSLTEQQFLSLAAKRQYFLDLVFYRSQVPKLKSSFGFQNRTEFQNLCTRSQDMSLTLTNGQFTVGKDSIRISNPNPFPMLYNLEQHAIVNQAFTVTKVSSGKILPKSSTIVTGKVDFGNKSESRSYTLSGIRDLPVKNGSSKIMDCVSIPAARKISYESIKLEAFAEQSGDTVTVYTKNVPDFVDAVKIERKDKYSDSYETLTSVPPNTPYVDQQIIEYTPYVYRVRFISGGCEVLEKITIPITVLEKKREILEIDFSVSLANSSANGNLITHVIQIDETRTTTVAGSLQSEIVSSGLSDKFDEERENNKSQLSVTSRYKITRVDLETGAMVTIPTLYSPGPITVSFNGDPTHVYKYIVKLLAVNTASVSYLTVVQREDVKTGNGYKFRYRKWRSSGIKRIESLPSQQQIVKNSLEDGVEIGGVGEQKTIEVSPSIKRPEVSDLAVQQDAPNRVNYLTWSVNGDVTEVDHFLILGEYSGSERVLGTASRSKFDSGSPFAFEDRKLANLLGEVKYRVILVERGMQFKQPVGPVSISIDQSVPERTLLRSNR